MIEIAINNAELKQALSNLAALPDKKIRPAARKGVRAGARPIWARTKALAPRGATRKLRRSVKVISRKDRDAAKAGEKGMIQATVRATAPHANIIEAGSKRHVIKPKNAKVLAWGKKVAQFKAVSGPGGVSIQATGRRSKVRAFARSVRHPGTKPNRFMARAAQQTQGECVNAFVAKLREVTA